ncbi:hypothetical protein, partial [Escherichia coli]
TPAIDDASAGAAVDGAFTADVEDAQNDETVTKDETDL